MAALGRLEAAELASLTSFHCRNVCTGLWLRHCEQLRWGGQGKPACMPSVPAFCCSASFPAQG